MKRKVLFLSYAFPYDYYNASTACSMKIMKALSEDPEYEVHCISYNQRKEGAQPYPSIPNVVLHPIPLCSRRVGSRFRIHLRMALKMPIYPIDSFSRIKNHYSYCKDICLKENFDLVIAQYNPEDSVFVGAKLKEKGYINKLAVIFWDNMYGKKPARFIPNWFATRRKKIAENYIAKYSDSLISLYPIKQYHLTNGELEFAKGKRTYLGIPSVIPPIKPVKTSYTSVIREGMFNVLYSGSIIKPEFLPYFIDILNQTKNVERINLIFFSKGVSEVEFIRLQKQFKGELQFPGYIPIKELLTIYQSADFFLSFPGDIHSICSKGFEYMSYGHPMIVLYNHPEDVNVSTFSKYPLCECVNVEESIAKCAQSIGEFIEKTHNEKVPFEIVEKMYYLDTPKAYVDLIKSLCHAT